MPGKERISRDTLPAGTAGAKPCVHLPVLPSYHHCRAAFTTMPGVKKAGR